MTTSSDQSLPKINVRAWADPALFADLRDDEGDFWDADAFAWMCAVGRGLRSWQLSDPQAAALRALVADALGRLDADGALAIRDRCELRVSSLAGALDDPETGDDAGDGEFVLGARDDLESVATVLRRWAFASVEDPLRQTALDSCVRWLEEQSAALDARVEAALDDWIDRGGRLSPEVIARYGALDEQSADAPWWVRWVWATSTGPVASQAPPLGVYRGVVRASHPAFELMASPGSDDSDRIVDEALAASSDDPPLWVEGDQDITIRRAALAVVPSTGAANPAGYCFLVVETRDPLESAVLIVAGAEPIAARMPDARLAVWSWEQLQSAREARLLVRVRSGDEPKDHEFPLVFFDEVLDEP